MGSFSHLPLCHIPLPLGPPVPPPPPPLPSPLSDPLSSASASPSQAPPLPTSPTSGVIWDRSQQPEAEQSSVVMGFGWELWEARVSVHGPKGPSWKARPLGDSPDLQALPLPSHSPRWWRLLPS